MELADESAVDDLMHKRQRRAMFIASELKMNPSYIGAAL